MRSKENIQFEMSNGMWSQQQQLCWTIEIQTTRRQYTVNQQMSTRASTCVCMCKNYGKMKLILFSFILMFWNPIVVDALYVCVCVLRFRVVYEREKKKLTCTRVVKRNFSRISSLNMLQPGVDCKHTRHIFISIRIPLILQFSHSRINFLGPEIR